MKHIPSFSSDLPFSRPAARRLPVRGGLLGVSLLCAVLAACSSTPRAPDTSRSESPRPSTQAKPSGGGYYKDDGPGDNPPPDLDRVPDAVPRSEPLHRFANRPYNVFGQEYVPVAALKPFRQRGVASWYGRRFHGKPTSSGEPYDMYAMTAAHPTLPIPSYARVTNLANGRSVVVRVNDRGPFLRGRIIDLSYAAAHRLGYVNSGHANVEVELVLPGAAPDVAPLETAAAPVAAPRPAPVPVPAAPAAVVAGTAALPTATAALDSGVYLQLGVFASRSNAEGLKQRVKAEMAELADRVLLLADGGRFRLHLGPWGSEGEARGVAEQVGRRLNLQPFVVLR